MCGGKAATAILHKFWSALTSQRFGKRRQAAALQKGLKYLLFLTVTRQRNAVLPLAAIGSNRFTFYDPFRPSLTPQRTAETWPLPA
jgi:hypothetical protein